MPGIGRRLAAAATALTGVLALSACGGVSAPHDQPLPPTTGIRPTAANTGVPIGTALQRHDGNLVITRAGTRYDSLDIHGFVFVEAPDVTITRSVIRGGRASSDTGLVNDLDPAATGFVITDSELVPSYPSVMVDGIKGSNYTATRLNIHGTVDGAKIFGNDTTIQNSYIHDLVLYPSDPDQGGGPTHNDGVQVLGGRHIRIVANTIMVGTDLRTALEVSQDYSATSDLRFTGNWAEGGDCTVNMTAKPRSEMTGITVSDNHFGALTRADCPILATRDVQVNVVGNVLDSTGRPARLRQTG